MNMWKSHFYYWQRLWYAEFDAIHQGLTIKSLRLNLTLPHPEKVIENIWACRVKYWSGDHNEYQKGAFNPYRTAIDEPINPRLEK